MLASAITRQSRPALPSWLRTTLAAGLLAGVAAGPAAAFSYSHEPGQASKWGSNTIGTGGGVVTWSLMADGTGLDPSVSGFGWSGTSTLSSVFAQVGGQTAAMAAIQAAFNAWSSVANITFVQVSESGALPFGAAYGAGQVVGSIRVGAFAFAPGDYTGAVGYAAPPNGGTTLEGDVIFNASNLFGIPAGSEGQPYNLYPPPNGFYLNDFASLITHEIGHALGLGHSTDPTALMCGYVNASFDGSQCAWADPDGNGMAPITRVPHADDIAGIQFLYGAAPVPEPRTWALWLAGFGVVGALARRRQPAGSATA